MWDPDLRRFDHLAYNLYIPRHYSSFGALVIHDGRNHTFEVGRGVWTFADFADFLGTVTPEIDQACEGATPEALGAALLASIHQPDRFPIFLERDGLRGR